MTETLQIGDLTFEVRHSYRRRTFGLTVDRAGELVVHVPAVADDDAIKKWIKKKLLWVHRKLALKEQAAPKMRAPEYVSGEGFCYLGRRFRLKIVDVAKEPLRLASGQFILRNGTVSAKEHFRRWYVENGSEWLRGRIDRLSHYVPKKPKRIEVRDLGFRWGSCGRNGVLFFNWRVFQLPTRFIDYVIMHELVHLSERHHGPVFWAALDQAMPDWQKRKQSLATSAKEYLVFDFQSWSTVVV
jgi:predicted metal-dependent hydrolase